MILIIIFIYFIADPVDPHIRIETDKRSTAG